MSLVTVKLTGHCFQGAVGSPGQQGIGGARGPRVSNRILFLEAHSLPRTSLSENVSLLGTDNVRGQISVHIFTPNGGYCLFIHYQDVILFIFSIHCTIYLYAKSLQAISIEHGLMVAGIVSLKNIKLYLQKIQKIYRSSRENVWRKYNQTIIRFGFVIQWLSIECQKYKSRIALVLKLAPPTQPIRCKTKTDRDLVTRVFPRLASVTCICVELSLVHFVVYVCYLVLIYDTHCSIKTYSN